MQQESDPPISAQKQALRQLLRAQRSKLAPVPGSPEACAASVAVAAHVDGAMLWPRHGRLAVYSAVRGELDPQPLANLSRLRGSEVYYPRMHDQPGLSFHRVRDAGELVPGPYGIPTPSTVTEPASGIDVFVVPGLGFDARGGRIGYGRGDYDATLRAEPQALRIGIGYDWQVVSAVPSEPHDEPLDLVVTPMGCIVTAARATHALCRIPHHKEDAT